MSNVLDQVLSDDQIRRLAPSVFAEQASPVCRETYSYLPTYPIIEHLRDRGMVVTQVREGKKRAASGQLYAMHEVRMRKADDVYGRQTGELGGVTPQIVLLNSHDKSTSATALAGLLRSLCHNGMYWADHSFGFKAVHYKMGMEKVLDGIAAVSGRFDEMIHNVDRWSKIQLTSDQRALFAQKAVEARGTALSIDPIDLLTVRRMEDQGTDLWSTYNVVQENLTTGGVVGTNKSGKWRSLRPIKALKVDSDFNRKLWGIANELVAA